MGRKSKKPRTSAGSNRAAHIQLTRTPFGYVQHVKQYDAKGLREELDEELTKTRQRRVNERMEEEKAKLTRLSGSADDVGSHDHAYTPSVPLESEDVLGGGVPLSISHAGGELLSILLDETENKGTQTYREWRTRRDHVENRNKAFKLQLPLIVRAYLEWDLGLGEGGLQDACPQFKSDKKDPQRQQGLRLRIMDVFHAFLGTRVEQTNIIDGPEGIPAALLRRGLVPCAPIRPSLAVSTRLLVLYHNFHLRCPHLSMQSYVQGLCDTHRIEYYPYLSTQFSICYDLFLEIRAAVSNEVHKHLSRSAPDWRLKNACPACTYRLEGEATMVYEMLVTMDGNDSLKRVIRKDIHEDLGNENGSTETTIKEVLDTRKVVGDYYLDRETVDRWAKDRVMDAIRESGIDLDNPCASRWTNMANEVTARMWGVFDETGIFLALCRHGFALVVADMVQSGELAKYPLAIVEALLNAFGPGIGVGYDIGCRFGTTLARSELGDRVNQMRLKMLVGAFHGHAHNRLCQLSNLATYVEGMGLEDLEGCERFFSKSNALAASLRYASVFHRRQRIAEYMKHMDTMETSQNLSEFLVNNYKQALRIIEGEQDLNDAMRAAGIDGPDIFHQWLKEEKDYLHGLSKEPEEETEYINYYRALVKLRLNEEEIQKQKMDFVIYEVPTPNDTSHSLGKRPRHNRGLRLMHARENYEKTLDKVHDIERDLQIEPGARWVPGSPHWNKAALLSNQQHYRRCLDELESLVVSRLFELTKMNMGETGYKLRKHIGNALRQRSQAIRNAIDRYNAAAAEMVPPREKLTWEKVVDYAFLTDFCLLRDCREDITRRSWARPHSRALMDKYFKICRAREEITRLNVEIRRVITYLQDEDAYLQRMEVEVHQWDPLIAHQIKHLRSQSMRFKDSHMRRFRKLAGLRGFSGNIDPGRSIDRSRHIDSDVAINRDEPTQPLTITQVQGEEQLTDQELWEEQEARRMQEIDQRYQLLSNLIQYEATTTVTT